MAAVAAGEIVFERLSGGSYTIQQRASSGALTDLSLGSGGYADHSPDVSPDGSKIVFIGERPVPGHSGNKLVSREGSNLTSR
jgi:hypothetical protein